MAVWSLGGPIGPQSLTIQDPSPVNNFGSATVSVVLKVVFQLAGDAASSAVAQKPRVRSSVFTHNPLNHATSMYSRQGGPKTEATLFY